MTHVPPRHPLAKEIREYRGNGREDSRYREDRVSRPSLRFVRARSGGAK
jgi:hypothetical protein